jgi:hypothetical protein
VFALSAIINVGHRTGWEESTSKDAGRMVNRRVTDARRWRQLRALADLPAVTPSARTVSRVRAGRRRRLYAPALDVVTLFQRLLARLDRATIRRAIEEHALITRDDAVLLELLCAFTLLAALEDQGWKGKQPGLLSGGRIFAGERAGVELDLFYQRTPDELNAGSRYKVIQVDHDFAGVGRLTPDFVVRVKRRDAKPRWLLVEVKGVDRPVADSARVAALDLLAYRRAFDAVLKNQVAPYGLGIAWGADLEPAVDSEVALCSPDKISQALSALV